MSYRLKSNVQRRERKHSLTFEQRNIFINLLREERYWDAKKLADNLTNNNNNNTLRTSVNRAGYDIVEGLKKSDFEKAKTLCSIFEDCHWKYWLTQ